MTVPQAVVPPAPLASLPAALAIRPMLLSDLEAVIQIELNALPTPWSIKGYEHELTQNKLATYQVLTRTMASGATFLLAYVGHWIIAGEAHISIITTDVQWRRRGLGELMLLSMLYVAIGQSAEMATLEVRESNHAAQSLYRKYQFEQVGIRRNYYKDTREDGLIMTVDALDTAYKQFLDKKREHLLKRLNQLD
jgi:ribosomal-protein-alanine N-acetyltransferase